MTSLLVGVLIGVTATAGWALLRRATRRRPAERRSNRSDTEQLANLASGLVHEIRNPLSSLKVNLQLLAEDWREAQSRPDPDLPRRSFSRLQTICNEADRLGNILEAFLRFVGHHELRLAPKDLNQIVQHLVDFFTPQARASRIQLRVSLTDRPLVCLLDADLIEQALMNVFVNAQQAMPDGGELIIRTSQEADRMARLDIADTGVGIAPEAIDKIWQAYYSTKKGGSGLGLPTTLRIVREHNGTITVMSEPQRGTNFTVRLPLAETA
ncbi:MAG: nitrogen regulation protein NR(II) [Phycisphaerae bacterium]